MLGFSTSPCVLRLERKCFLQCCCPVATEWLIQWHRKSRMGRQHLTTHPGARLSPCLLSLQPCHCPCAFPAPAPSQAALQGETKGIKCEAQEVKGCKRSPGVRRCQSLPQEDARDGTGSRAWRGTEVAMRPRRAGQCRGHEVPQSSAFGNAKAVE